MTARGAAGLAQERPLHKEKIMSQETLLVTGAAGAVGSTARVAIAILLEQGHRVRAMVRKLDARADALRDKRPRWLDANLVSSDRRANNAAGRSASEP
jgi:nucleoside-diphosphate-sugar epimerase